MEHIKLMLKNSVTRKKTEKSILLLSNFIIVYIIGFWADKELQKTINRKIYNRIFFASNAKILGSEHDIVFNMQMLSVK